MDSRKDLGAFGERMATMVLLRKGYRIRARNVRTPFGEIDIIAESPKEILFIEVKTRTSQAFGQPEEAITEAKRMHIARSVESYRASEKILERPFRVDAIAILLDETTRRATIRHVENILE